MPGYALASTTYLSGRSVGLSLTTSLHSWTIYMHVWNSVVQMMMMMINGRDQVLMCVWINHHLHQHHIINISELKVNHRLISSHPILTSYLPYLAIELIPYRQVHEMGLLCWRKHSRQLSYISVNAHSIAPKQMLTFIGHLRFHRIFHVLLKLLELHCRSE